MYIYRDESMGGQYGFEADSIGPTEGMDYINGVLPDSNLNNGFII